MEKGLIKDKLHGIKPILDDEGKFQGIMDDAVKPVIIGIPSAERMDEQDNNINIIAEISEKLQVMTTYSDYSLNENIEGGIKSIFKRFILMLKKQYRKLVVRISPTARKQIVFNQTVTPAIGKLTEVVNSLNQMIQDSNQQTRETVGTGLYLLQKNSLQIDNEAQEMIADLILQRARDCRKIDILEKRIDELYKELDSRTKTMNTAVYLSAKNGNSQTYGWEIPSASQSGEDMILISILQEMGITPENCFYLEILNDVSEYSNTLMLYSFGARGVLTVSDAEKYKKWKEKRPEDIILHCSIEPDISTEKDTEKQNDIIYDKKSDDSKDNRKNTIRKTINDIMKDSCDRIPTVLCINDANNCVDIINSIEFSLFRPALICIRVNANTALDYNSNCILSRMNSNNYIERINSGNCIIFADAVKEK